VDGMKKIPVGATIGYAYRFGFDNFLTVLRAIWIALACQLILSMVVAKRAALVLSAFQAHDPSAQSLAGPLLLLYLLILILFVVQSTAAMEVTLGLYDKASFFHVPLGKRMWRLLGGLIVAALAIAAAIIAYGILIALLASLLKLGLAGAKAEHVVMILSAFLALLVGIGAMIYLPIRFLFLLAPINIKEQHLGVMRAWQLSAGNFWRALLVILSILLPIIVVEYALIFAVVGFPPIPHGQDVLVYQSARVAWNAAVMQIFSKYWYLAMPLSAVVMVLYLGITSAAQVFAYRFLTQE
jgi:hypothetical protein